MRLLFETQFGDWMEPVDNRPRDLAPSWSPSPGRGSDMGNSRKTVPVPRKSRGTAEQFSAMSFDADANLIFQELDVSEHRRTS
jgi:hypothetical protein